MDTSKRTTVQGLGALVLSALAAPLHAQAPASQRPLQWLVGSTAGSGLDVMARIVAEGMAPELGQTVVVENRPGAAGTIAAAALMSAPADGHTVLHVDMGTYSLNPFLYRKLAYDPLRDFTMIGMMATMPMVLVVPVSLNVTTVKDFVAYVKSKPEGSVSFASSGTGNPTHLTMELFARQAGLKMTMVPYRGSPAALADIATGQVAAMFVDPNTPAPFVQSGKLRYVAFATPARIPTLPQVPTTKEAGYDVHLPVWVGLAVHKNTPAPQVERLNTALNVAMQNAVVRKKLSDIGFQVNERMTAAQSDEFARADHQRSGRNLAPMNLQLD